MCGFLAQVECEPRHLSAEDVKNKMCKIPSGKTLPHPACKMLIWHLSCSPEMGPCGLQPRALVQVQPSPVARKLILLGCIFSVGPSTPHPGLGMEGPPTAHAELWRSHYFTTAFSMGCVGRQNPLGPCSVSPAWA